MISLLCPSRGRASLCHRMVQSALSTSTKGNVEILIGTVEPYLAIHNVTQIQVPEWSTVMTWNHLAQHAKGDLLMLCADDVIFSTPGWSEALLKHYEKLVEKRHVYSLQDSRDENGTPHPIVTKEYMATMDYFMPPLFFHWQIDTWTVQIAKANHCFTHMKEYLLMHDKSNDHGKPDRTHLGIREQGWNIRDEYVAKTCKHFLEAEKFRLGYAMRDSSNLIMSEQC